MPLPKFFRFREQRYWKGSRPVVGFASKELVSSLFDIEEMSEIFGGYLEYEDGDGSLRYLGVWGDRKVGRFLLLLRERGAMLQIEEADPDQFRQRRRVSKQVRKSKE
ncbi:MAG: hypothetical protein PSV46_14205 [Reyranella sp.]|nr:hypothetical protein [Reyranella sp.]